MAKQAIKLAPKFADAYATLCINRLLEGNKEEAQLSAKKLLEIEPDFKISAYVEARPYRDAEKLSTITEALRSVGIPN